MRCKAYDRFRRLVRESRRHVAHRHARRSRCSTASTPGVIVEQPLLDRPLPQRPQARHGRGRLASTLAPGRPFLLRRPQPRGRAVQGHRHHRPRLVQVRRGSSPTAGSACRCRPTSPTASATCSPTATTGTASPTTSANGWRCRSERSTLPEPHQLLVETFPHERLPLHGRLQLRRLERAPVARHADHQADGECGPEAARLRRQRLWPRLLRAGADHRSQGALLARHPRAGIRRLGRAEPICSRPPSAKSR